MDVEEQIIFPKADPNTTIQVDKEAVEVNSHVLALSSAYFDRYFFDDRYPKAENIELPESTTVEDFKRMLATLYGHKLDDECIEAIIILADRFFMDNVMKLCRDFLQSSESGKPKLFKLRMAHNYGWKEMKEEILQSMKLDDLTDNFVENAEEFAMLNDDVKAAVSARHSELVVQKSARIHREALPFRAASPCEYNNCPYS